MIEDLLGRVKGRAQHPSVREWLRWREGMPLAFGSLAEMPLGVAEGFMYLCNKYGKDELTPPRSNHNRAVADAQRSIDEFHARSAQIPTLTGHY